MRRALMIIAALAALLPIVAAFCQLRWQKAATKGICSRACGPRSLAGELVGSIKYIVEVGVWGRALPAPREDILCVVLVAKPPARHTDKASRGEPSLPKL